MKVACVLRVFLEYCLAYGLPVIGPSNGYVWEVPWDVSLLQTLVLKAVGS